MDIKKLLQIVTVARRGNFSRAAEDLHITQPALSRSIAALEERFGMRIFERGRNGASLTPVGAQVVAEAEKLLRNMRAFDHNLHLYSKGRVGRVAFGMGPLISSLIMPGLGRHFLHERPELLLKTVVKSAQQLVAEIMDDQIEVMFCATGQIEDHLGLYQETVGELEISTLVRAEHPLGKRDSVTSADLQGYPVLSGAELSTASVAPETGGLIFDNYHILREMTLQTDSIWISSPQLVSEELRSGQLRCLQIPDQQRPMSVEIAMICSKGRQLTPAAQAVVEYVRDYFAGVSSNKEM